MPWGTTYPHAPKFKQAGIFQDYGFWVPPPAKALRSAWCGTVGVDKSVHSGLAGPQGTTRVSKQTRVVAPKNVGHPSVRTNMIP